MCLQVQNTYCHWLNRLKLEKEGQVQQNKYV